MLKKENITIIDKKEIPEERVKGTYTFLRDIGNNLANNKAILINTMDATEAKRTQNRWRSYFKDKAHTKKKVEDGKITVYLWLEK